MHAKTIRAFQFMALAPVLMGAMLSLTACGHKKERPKADLAAATITTIGVNSYLWRATLDTVGFMPLLQTDSNGGVILTDWYANPNAPGERMKLTVSILDKELRADALQVGASRQVLQGGQWIDQPVQAATTQKIEEIILTRARDLRQRALGG
jgi:predicted small lipoprotein YifL